MQIDTDMMLDALCLAAYSDTDETKILLGQVLSIYQDLRKKNQDSIDLDLEVFFNEPVKMCSPEPDLLCPCFVVFYFPDLRSAVYRCHQRISIPMDFSVYL